MFSSLTFSLPCKLVTPAGVWCVVSKAVVTFVASYKSRVSPPQKKKNNQFIQLG